MWYLAVLLVLITTLLAMSFGIRLTEELERENRLVEAELESSGIYSEALSRKAAEARRYRHDAAGLMQAIERQLAQGAGDAGGGGRIPVAGDAPTGTGMAPQSPAGAGSTMQANRTGYLLVDAILNLKEAQCCEKRVAFELLVEPLAPTAADAGIPEGDMAALIQNLLDNAIEASERVDEPARRLVRLRAHAADGKLAILVENRTETSERPTFRTRKSNPELHGLGTGIVEDIVKAHGGAREVVFDPATRILSVSVTFPLQQGAA